MPAVQRYYGQQLRLPIMTLRNRLYLALNQIQPKYYEGMFYWKLCEIILYILLFLVSFSQLLRELVAEITFADNTGVPTATSLVSVMCNPSDRTLLRSWLQDTDHRIIEEQVRFYYYYWQILLENIDNFTFGGGAYFRLFVWCL